MMTVGMFLTELRVQAFADQPVVQVRARYGLQNYAPHLFAEVGIDCPAPIAKAVPKRQAEYLAGRLVAQQALLQLGAGGAQVALGRDRAPVWPAGYQGSISHSHGRCACLLARSGGLLCGIDVERIAQGAALDAIIDKCLLPAERVAIDTVPHLSREAAATVVFSAKEVVFKALFPIVGRYFGFDCAEASFCPGQESVRCRLTQDLHASLPAGLEMEIRYQSQVDTVLTWAVLARPT